MANAKMKHITFEGHDFTYDPSATKKYKVLKQIASAAKDPAGFFEAFEVIFAGKDEEYAEVLGEDLEKMGALVNAVMGAEGGDTKN